MRKVSLTVFIVFCFSSMIKAQKNGSVKGTAFDTAAKQPVVAATISVLDMADSSLVSFTMTGSNGQFEISGIPFGKYRLLITHVNYHNRYKNFSVSDTLKVADLGTVVMHDKAKTLEEVVVTNEAPPITLINDTIQYNAGSFKTQPNANVEQLLKKLPGIKVEKDGTVKAQGEKVNRVLVDGKEFFGNDPKIATKNLPADAVDKVQVYDRQSEQAQLTGFDDGNYEKTINLKLKQDKKKGMFGKVMAGGGNKERYEEKFNVNSFKGARQFSAIGMGNNTNAEGFSFMDILNFTGELARMQRGGGGNISINLSGEDAAAMGINMGGRNSGINTAWGGGLNYNNIIGTKLDMQSNYFYNRFSPENESHIQREYFYPQSNFYNQDTYSDNLSNNHRLNLNLLYQLDSLNTLRIIPSVSVQKTNNRNLSGYQTLSGSHLLLNEGYSNSNNKNEGCTLRNEVIWRKKFFRKGRTFSVSLQTSLNESEGSGSLMSVNNFFDGTGMVIRRDTLNQINTSNGDLKSYNVRAVYTEPIGKRSLLELSAGRSNSKSTSDKETYDYDNGKYDRLNELQSNDFENTYGYTNAGLRWRTQKKKFSLSLGASWQRAELEGKIISGTRDSVIGKPFTNVLPNARLQYNFTRFKTLTFSYNTSTNQPSMQQLQPVPDMSIPLNVKYGNPGLKQEYNHNFQANLTLVNPYRNKNLFFFLTMRATNNKIVNYDSLNLTTGERTSKPMNVSGVYNLNGNFSYSMPVKFLKGTVEFSNNTAFNRTKQFVNDAAGKMNENTISTWTLGPDVRFDINPTQKIGFSIGAGLAYNKTKYSIQKTAATDYLSQEYSATVDWELPKGFYFSSDFTYTANSQRASGFNTKIPLWNTSISKQVLKFNRGELKFSAVDLLNRNIGISRNTNNNYIEDSRVLTLRRFVLLRFTYSLSKTGLNNAGGGGMIRMIRR